MAHWHKNCFVLAWILIQPSLLAAVATTEPALHQAARNNRLKEVNQILLSGGEVNQAFGEKKQTPLHLAASLGHVDVVTALISAKAEVNAKDASDGTPLHLAADSGHADVMKQLVRVPNLDINAADVDGWTPLHFAAAGGSLNAVKVLVAAGADLELEIYNNQNAMHLAAGEGNDAVVEYLFERKAALLKTVAGYGTPLHKAAAMGHVSTVLKLIQLGADINALNKSKETPLHVAVVFSGSPKLIKALLDHKPRLNEKDSRSGDTPLLRAVECERWEAAILLARAGADVNVADSEGRTPLHQAALGHPDAVKCLIESGAATDAKDERGRTPADYAKSSPKEVKAQILDLLAMSRKR